MQPRIINNILFVKQSRTLIWKKINERNIGIGVFRPGRIHGVLSRMKAPGPKPSVLAPACSTSSEDEGALEGSCMLKAQACLV